MFEILMAVWVLSGVQRRLSAIAQIALVAVMNAIELVLAPDLLLWGHFNAVFALAFIAILWVNEWVLGPVAVRPGR